MHPDVIPDPVWKLENISLIAPGPRLRLKVDALEIGTGTTAVIGWSGAGKTSLLNILAGYERVQRGTATLPPRMAWAPQSHGLWQHSTVSEHLTLCGASSARAKELLSAFDLEPLADRHPDALSEGEAARLSIARAIAADAPAMVLDEPLAHVDPARAGKYWCMLRKHAEGRAMVFSTHRPEEVLAEASRVICLAGGLIVWQGSVMELYDSPPTPELMTFLGPGNWFGTDTRWLPNAGVVRPERMCIEAAATGPEVVASRFSGAVAETELRAADGETRAFFHRPVRPLAAGTRVALRVLGLVIAMFYFAACGKPQGMPVIAVKESKVWMLPPEGAVQPTPRSMTTGPNDELAVLDTSGRVLIYDKEGALLRQWKMLDVQFGKPEGIVWLKDNSLVVCDTHYHRLVWFDQNGGLIRTVGKRGTAAGEFVFPVGIAKDPDENLYVCEYGGHDRIQVFARDGKWLREFGSAGTGTGQFQRPSGLAWHEGRVFIADSVNNRVHIYKDDGTYVGLLGAGSDGKSTLEFNLPYDIALAPDGAFYVIEYGAGRLSKISTGGTMLARYGSTGTGDGNFATPWGLTVDSRMRVYVADTKNRRLVSLQL